jgi:hypothetical protein
MGVLSVPLPSVLGRGEQAGRRPARNEDAVLGFFVESQ